MPTLDLWHLPGAPTAPGQGTLGTVTREAGQRVYYTARGDTLGELDAGPGIARQWLIPASLHAAGPNGPGLAGITRDRHDIVWSALASAGRLLRLDPRSGVMTAYGSNATTPLPHQFPFSMPLRVELDRRGRPWYAGLAVLGQPQGPIVGWLDPQSGATTYWVLNHLPMMLATNLWLQAKPARVWLSLLHWNHQWITSSNIPLLACLDPLTGAVDIWSRVHTPPAGMFHYLAGAQSVRGDDAATPRAIWFVHHTGFSPATILRLNVANGRFSEFTTPASQFQFGLDLDSSAMPWANTAPAQLTGVRNLKCGVPVSLSRHSVTLPAQKMIAPMRSARVRPVNFELKHEQRGIERRRSDCFDAIHPLGVVPVEPVAAATGTPAIWFAARAPHVIGKLAP